MSWLGQIFGSAAAEPIEAIGNVLDKLFTSDDERLSKQVALERLQSLPALAQIELNKVEATHRSIFVAGWRPFIGWICGVSLAGHFLLFPIINSLTNMQIHFYDEKSLIELVYALLGLGAFRTVEKLGNKSK